MNIITYEISETLNSKVNFEKLDFELKTSPIPTQIEVESIKGKIYCNLTEPLGDEDIEVLTTLIGNHDGEEAEVTQTKVDTRETGIRELVQMAFYHPSLDNNVTTSFLTEIDNAINAFIRGGNYSVLVGLIMGMGAEELNPFYSYLNIQVNTSGATAWQFFVSKIMAI